MHKSVNIKLLLHRLCTTFLVYFVFLYVGWETAIYCSIVPSIMQSASHSVWGFISGCCLGKHPKSAFRVDERQLLSALSNN